MTSLQRQYMLCPSLTCNTARTRLSIDSVNRRIRSCRILPILAQEPVAVLAEFAALVDDCTRVDPYHPTNVILGSNLVIQTTKGALLHSGWLESQQYHELCAAERCRAGKTSIRRFIAGSMCGVKTSSLYRAALRLPWMCTS